jgi:phosphate:Na+ symporter
MFTKKQSYRYLGDILLGFAVLMFGMSTMSKAVGGLGQAEWFTAALTTMSHPLLGILVGALFTAILQSASAAVGIVQALSVTGAITFDAALPLLMGISIGASVPVMFSAIGANTDGRRTAIVYPIVTGFGVLISASLFYIANAIFRFDFLSQIMNPFSLAIINTLLRLVMVLILLPFLDVIEAAVTALISNRKKSAENAAAVRLEDRFLAHPPLAIEQSRLTINEMAETSEQALQLSLSLIGSFHNDAFEKVQALETLVDKYEDSLGTYLVKLTGQEMTGAQSDDVAEYLHTLSDFERISDHALNLSENAKELSEKNIRFSDNALHELEVLSAAVSHVMNITVTAFRTKDLVLAGRVEPLEEVIDNLCDQMKLNHVDRLQRGICTINQGFIFNDIITNCERVSDHCSNIAVAMIELSGNALQTHEYTQTLRERNTQAFQDAYKEYTERFAI